MKRSMGTGYSDIPNPGARVLSCRDPSSASSRPYPKSSVFFKPATSMLLGDAKKTTDALVTAVAKLLEEN